MRVSIDQNLAGLALVWLSSFEKYRYEEDYSKKYQREFACES